MVKPILELDDNLSWNRFYGNTLQATQRDTGGFNPIPKQSALCPSNILCVGAQSDVAQPYWYTGAWFELGISMSPGSTSPLVAGMYFGRGRAPLGNLALYHFPAYQPAPYIVIWSIPRWLTQVYLEGWWYDGPESDTIEQALGTLQGSVGEMQIQLDRIETKLD
jgi:hypothetical protein